MALAPIGEIRTASGAKLFIGSSRNIDTRVVEGERPEEDIIADFETEDWIEVGTIEDFGEGGDESADVTFTAVGDSRVRHLKGARDAGTRTFVVGDDPFDPGQQQMTAAEKTKFNYNFKIEIPNAPDENYRNGVEYFRGPVMSRRRSLGTNDNVIRRNFVVGNTSGVFEVLPTEIP